MSEHNSRTTKWVLTLGGVDLGEYDGANPTGLAALYNEIKIASLGDVVLDMRSKGGLTGLFEPDLRQLTPARVAALCPWHAEAGNPAIAPEGKLMSEYAKPLRMHPADVTGPGEDLVLLLAVNLKPFLIDRDNNKPDVYKPQFQAFPEIGEDGSKSWITYGV